MTTLQNVTCDNCSASYSIDFSKLKREKNRITCRRCQHKIVFYKNKMLEPQNEAVVVDHADEKTLVEDERKPNAQQYGGSDPKTEVSKNTPPVLSHQPEIVGKEVSDPTVRRNLPLETEEKPRVEILKPESKVSVEKKASPPHASPSNKQSKGGDPLGLRGALQLCAGMMVLGLLSILGMHFSSGTIADMAFLIGASSLTMGTLWLVTSDFGFSKPSMGISLGGASIVAVVSGALVFGSASRVEEKQVSEEPIEEAPTVDVADSDTDTDTEKKATFDRSQSNKPSKGTNRSMGATTATVRDVEKSNQAHKDMFAAANQYISEKESSKPKSKPREIDSEYEVDDAVPSRPNDVPTPSEPTELLEDDLDLDGFDDLGLDDEEEEKKGLFGRKEKEESKPDKKAAAKPKSDIKVDIPTNVLDIIIRNNKNVKACYGQVRAETGTFPKSVDVMFTLQPTGKVSSAYIASGPYVGSKFEGCMRAAFKGMTFPTFDKDASPQTLKYNLKL